MKKPQVNKEEGLSLIQDWRAIGKSDYAVLQRNPDTLPSYTLLER